MVGATGTLEKRLQVVDLLGVRLESSLTQAAILEPLLLTQEAFSGSLWVYLCFIPLLPL